MYDLWEIINIDIDTDIDIDINVCIYTVETL